MLKHGNYTELHHIRFFKILSQSKGVTGPKFVIIDEKTCVYDSFQ